MTGLIASIALGAFVVVMYKRGFDSGRTSGKKDSVRSNARNGAEAVREFFKQDR